MRVRGSEAIAALALVALVTSCAPDEVARVVPAADTSVAGAYRSDAERTGAAAGVIGDDPRVVYRIDGGDPVIASPVIVGETAFVPNDSGDLIAFAVSSGEVRWRSMIGDAEASVVASTDSVFSVSSGGVVRRHDIGSGIVVWETAEAGFARSSPMLSKGELVVAIGQELILLDPSTGVRRGSVDLGGRTDSSPAVAADVVVIGTGSNGLVFVDRETFGLQTVDFPDVDNSLTTYADGVAATPAIAGNSVFVGSTGGQLLSATLSGDVEWMVDIGSPMYGAVAVGDGLGYIPTASGELIAFALEDGAIAWSSDLGDAAYASPVLVGSVVLATAENGRLFAFDAATGIERWNLVIGEPGNYMASTPAVFGSMIVVGSNDGSIVGVSTDG